MVTRTAELVGSICLADKLTVQLKYCVMAIASTLLSNVVKHSTSFNPLPTNDAPMRHDLCKLSISLWEFIWGV